MHLWQIEGTAITATWVYHEHAETVTAIDVHCDTRRCVTGSDDRTLRHWCLEQGVVLHTFEYAGMVTGLSGYWPSERWPSGRIMSNSHNNLKIWDLQTGAMIWAYEDHMRDESRVPILHVNWDRNMFISGTNDFNLAVWDLCRAQVQYVLRGHTHLLTSCTVDW